MAEIDVQGMPHPPRACDRQGSVRVADEYFDLVQEIREAVCAALPPSARLLVTSKGDDDLLNLGGRTAQHFPKTRDRECAHYHPAGSLPAIAHLEFERGNGAEYFLLPRTAFWWLDHYQEFREHLDGRFSLIDSGSTCRIYDLRRICRTTAPMGSCGLPRLLAEFRARLRRRPAILDWNSGLDLGGKLPHHIVFSPPSSDSMLPYLDSSTDVVVLAGRDALRLNEARRVAEHAVVLVNDPPAVEMHVEWKSSGPAPSPATVSILVPTYNAAHRAVACLRAVLETLPDEFVGEILVVDDASTDNSLTMLRHWSDRDSRIRVHSNPQNLGFLQSCNVAAGIATGQFLVFLNDDTIPLPGWLQTLVSLLEARQDAGAVGGRLLYPDGALQEAGGVVFRNGTAANLGRGDVDPQRPLYEYVRAVDYCSGALLATRRSLFLDVGGFDTRFSPAYYEDTDFCFELRSRGLRTYYQPLSRVVHVEGASSGTDITTGVKRHQELNRAKFATKWTLALAAQPEPPTQYHLATWYALALRGGRPGEDHP